MVGTQVKAYVKGQIISGDNYTVRGYQSSVPPQITLGVGAGVDTIDSLIIHWPNNDFSVIHNVIVNHHYHFEYESMSRFNREEFHTGKAIPFSLHRVDSSTRHLGSGLVEFNRERLLPIMYCTESPALLKADIDSDGRKEIYLGGGKGQSGTFFHFDHAIRKTQLEELQEYSLPEETEGVFFDADNDGDQDFYFATGGRFYPTVSTAQRDRLFLNLGKGRFKESGIPLPLPDFSTSKVLPIDFDQDGDLDLVVTERFDPFVYGRGGRGYLLQNNGSGEFENRTKDFAPDLLNQQMITDGVITDYNLDGWPDLILVGDWMPITFLRNTNGQFELDPIHNLKASTGWWNTIESADLNHDGKPDFVIGNHGNNSFFQPGIRMYLYDFDDNGSVEQIFCSSVGGRYSPIIDKDDLVSQIPSLKKSLIYYKDYQDKSIEDILGEELISKAKVVEAQVMASSLILSSSQGYHLFELPQEAQYSPIYAVLLDDLDGDGVVDMLAGGNQYRVKPQFGRFDASQGWFFKGHREGESFQFLPGVSLGISGEIRDIESIEVNGYKFLIFAKYDDALEIFNVGN